MAQNKKTRRPYSPNKRAIIVPMMHDRHYTEAMRLHTVIGGFCDAPSADLFNESTRLLAGVIGALTYLRGRAIKDDLDAAAIALRTCIRTLEVICQRYEELDILVVYEFEAMSLCGGAGAIDDCLARIPVNVLDAARIHVEAAVRVAATDNQGGTA